MENFSVTKTERGFHIEGFPDAVKVIRLDGPKARRVADLALHKADLDFALECLAAIDNAPPHPSPIRQALWQSAIVRFFKCFLNSHARSSLKAEEIYEGDQEGLELFEHFRALRNKHVVHDENSYAQCISGAALNKEELDHKIAKIVCFSATADTLDQASYSNLHLLCTRARAWVVKQFDALCDEFTAELEKEPYEDLVGREGPHTALLRQRMSVDGAIPRNRTYSGEEGVSGGVCFPSRRSFLLRFLPA